MVTTPPPGVLPGVIDTLTEGFAIVNKRPWLLLLPILFDLLLLFGPGISFGPVLDKSIAQLDLAQESSAAVVLTETTAVPDPTEVADATAVAQAADENRAVLESFKDGNLLGVLVWQLPSVVAITSGSPLPVLGGPVLFEVTNNFGLGSVAVVLAVAGLFVTSLYLAGIAQAVRQEPLNRDRLVEQAIQGWKSLLALLGLGLLLSIPVGLALVIFSAIAGVLGNFVLVITSTLFLALVMVVAFYLYFVDDAIFIAPTGAIRAVRYSVGVISRHFRSVLGLFLLVQIILLGAPIVLRFIVGHPIGMLASIGVHAYIATGLATGAMIFFQRRLDLWQRTAVPEAAPAD